MASHKLHKLTSLFVKKTTAPGKYGDGHGLYLIVDASGAKRWEQRLVDSGQTQGYWARKCGFGEFRRGKRASFKE